MVLPKTNLLHDLFNEVMKENRSNHLHSIYLVNHRYNSLFNPYNPVSTLTTPLKLLPSRSQPTPTLLHTLRTALTSSSLTFWHLMQLVTPWNSLVWSKMIPYSPASSLSLSSGSQPSLLSLFCHVLNVHVQVPRSAISKLETSERRWYLSGSRAGRLETQEGWRSHLRLSAWETEAAVGPEEFPLTLQSPALCGRTH